MTIGNETYNQIIILDENNEVLAVISDDEIVEKCGVNVILDKKD